VLQYETTTQQPWTERATVVPQCTHFSYDSSFPFPPFHSHTSFIAPNTLILNTGNSIQCVQFSIPESLYNVQTHSTPVHSHGIQTSYSPFDFDTSSWVHTTNTKLSVMHRWPLPKQEILRTVTFNRHDNISNSTSQIEVISHDAFSCEAYLVEMIKKIPSLHQPVSHLVRIQLFQFI
jgi:hypothetical protein